MGRGRTPIESSYIVDLVQIAKDIYNSLGILKPSYEVVIPVYQNNFKRSIAERLVFLTNTDILRSIDSNFVEKKYLNFAGLIFSFEDKFETGNECGYKFGSLEIEHPEDSPITLSYYWR